MDLQNNKRQKKDIILEENGRLFPLWIMQNFKKYVLPHVIIKEGEDPCNEKLSNELTLYQKFISSYLDYRSPFRDLLVYHGLGSGKTRTIINLYNILYNYTPKWNIFVIMPASLHDEWLSQFKLWLTEENKEDRLKNIIMVHFDSPFADRDFLEKIKKCDSSKPFVFIIDEVHRFINNVYNNVSSKKGKRAQIIYDYIQQEKKENSNNRVLLLSATPTTNNAFELALIFNLLRPNIFPSSEALFNQIYISSTNFASLNEDTKNQFQRRIMGLVSYYLGATPDKFATKITHYKNIVMGEYQESIYNELEIIEEKKEKIRMKMSKGKIGGDEMSTYNAYTRQACNFVFPTINNEITGEKRPRPAIFKIKETEAMIIDEGKDLNKKVSLLKANKELNEYLKAIKIFVNSTLDFFKEFHRKDKEQNHTLQDDIKKCKEKYNSSLTDFIENENKKSNLFKQLYICSPKMVTIIFNILKSKGPVLVYSNYVEMEGLQMFKIYLQFFGFINFQQDDEIKINKLEEIYKKDYYRYLEYHGGIEKDIRILNKSLFNNKINKHGKISKILMISPAGAEGLNLYNVRQVHIMEPYWNEVRIEQVIGRAIRQCHHADLPINERIVDVFRYKMIRENGKETADEKLENISRRKNNLLLSFMEAIKEVAVDCELFKAHNMIGSKYKCFNFNEESLFDENIGPAYQEKYEYDNKINNGSNSKESIRQKIKVRKIKAVQKISNNNYSQPKNYWYYNKSRTIYDYELNYPVGKIEIDENGNEVKIDEDTYIIEKLITIPEFKLY
jgi:superfamily II DNA or RNA helicase